MNVERLDGFVTALTCGPEDPSPIKFVRRIIGRMTLFDSCELSVPNYLRDLVFLVARLSHARLAALRSGRTILPLLRNDPHDTGLGEDWARGFVREVQSNEAAWRPLMEDAQFGGCIAPIFALAHESDPDSDLRLFVTPLTDTDRRRLIACIDPSLSTIYRFHNRQRTFPSEYTDLYRSA
jgi:uncharacterized protein